MMRWPEMSRMKKGVGLLGLVMLLLPFPAALAQGGKTMDTKGLSPAALSIFKQQASPAVLAKKAGKGDDNAALMLGYMYRLGHKVKKDPAKAVGWFKKSADKGNAEAQLQMAIMYAAGEGVKQDYGAMRRWLQKSAENGYGLSQFQLGLLYAKGITVDQDIAVARMWLGFAAEQPGDIGQMAKTVLANLREEASAAGLDFIAMPVWVNTAEKYGKALAILQEGADRGDARSQYLLGLVFNWLGASDAASPMNVFYKEAALVFRKAADKGYPPAQHMLGVLYLDGRGVMADDGQALSWLEKAGELGYAPAQVTLGAWYDGGHARRDPAQAKLWYERAKAKRNWYAKAYFAEEEIIATAPNKRDMPVRQWDARDQYVMALAYEKGSGVPADPEQAVAWYRLAAMQLLVPAQRRLGLAYLKGKGVAADDAEAFTWLSLAAEQDDAEAEAGLAALYAAGRGVSSDEKRAFALYTKSADEGVTEAEEGLGMMLLDGRGTKKNPAEAKKWLEKAAPRSGTAAEQMLAIMQAEAE
ncbi:SEL1-like repeat protein [Oxalobacter sp. OttesenSCG-928-P03]|nr:SEL1-like repeat protein [Oxalobacter sp. OttesenSCG-928-P03]